MSAKINIQIQEKKWSKVDLRKLSKKAFKSIFKILSYPQLFKFLEVSILACNDKKIKEYNKNFRAKDKATNVLSWPRLEKIQCRDLLEKKDFSYLISIQEGTLDIGDIAISYDTCLKKAKELNFTFEDYTIYMLIHSCLHLLGFDHKKKSDFKLMKELEIKSLRVCGIKNPYNIY